MTDEKIDMTDEIRRMAAGGAPVFLELEGASWSPPSGAALWLAGDEGEGWCSIVCEHASLNRRGIDNEGLLKIVAEWDRGQPCECDIDWLRFTEPNIDAMLKRLGHGRPNPFEGGPMAQAGRVMHTLAAGIDASPASRPVGCTCPGGPDFALLLQYDSGFVRVSLGHAQECPIDRDPDDKPSDLQRLWVPGENERAN